MPQKLIIEFNIHLAEYVECSKELFCAITKEVSRGVMHDNTSIYNETYITSEIHQMYSESLDPLRETFMESFVYQESNSTITSTTLPKKSNQLIDAVKPKPASNAVSSNTVCNKRQNAYYDYEAPVAGDSPFVRQECRRKAHQNITERNPTHRGKQITDNKTVVLLQFRPEDDHRSYMLSIDICGKFNAYLLL